MKAKIFIALIFNIAIAKGQSSTTFNKTYNDGVDNCFNILEVPGGYLTAVSSGFPITPRKTVLKKIDFNGDLIWQKIYGDSVTYDFFYSLLKTIDDNFIMGTSSFDFLSNRNLIKLIKCDSIGDTIWTKKIQAPLGFDYFPQYFINSSDKGFIITGQISDTLSSNPNGLLVKTDSLGNFEWQSSIGGGNYDIFYSSVELNDKSVLSLGFTRSYGAGDRDWYLVKTDSMGQFIWQKTFGSNELDTPNGITSTADSNFLLAGGGWLNGTTFYGRIIKVDSSGAIIVQKNYTNYPGSEFWWARENIDGSIITVGANKLLSTDNGWITKLDANLNVIWSRSFRKNNAHAYFRDVQATTDGGYIAAGFAFQGASGNQDAWLVKLDSMGCDSIGCATYVTGIDEPTAMQKDLSVFPNPAKEYITLSLPLPMFTACRIRIYDVIGKQVMAQQAFLQKELSVPVHDFSPGIYVVEVLYEEKKEYAKFIKE